MTFDGPEDRGPLAAIEMDHGERGTQLSPITWMLIIGGVVVAFVVLLSLL